MKILLDTDVVSAIVKRRENPRLLEQIAAFPQEDTYVASVTVREVLYGMRRKGKVQEEERFEAFIRERVIVLPFDLLSACYCADVQVWLEKRGIPLSLPDLEIAGLALAYDLDLVTGNDRHFSRIPDLALHNWLEG